MDVGKGSDSPREFTDAYGIFCPFHSGEISFHLIIPEGHFEAEACGFGMDPMGPPNHQGLFVFEGLLLQDIQKAVDVLENDFRSLFQQQSERGIQDIGGGESVMKVFG
jgi:hypothetical protein